MEISPAMLNDLLHPYSPDFIGFDDNNSGFKCVRLWSSDLHDFSHDTLYVCFSEQLEPVHAKIKNSGLTFLCPLGRNMPQPNSCPGCRYIYINAEHEQAGIFNLVSDFFQKMNEWERELEHSVYIDKSFNSLISVGNECIDGYLLLWDRAFNVLAHSKPPQVMPESLATTIRDGYFNELIIQYLEKNKLISTADQYERLRILDKTQTLSGKPFYLRHITKKSRISVSVGCSVSSELSSGDREILALFFDYVEQLSAILPTNESSDSYRDAFLHDIISGGVTDENEISKRAKAFGIDSDKTFLFYVIEFEDFSQLKAQLLMDTLRRRLNDDLMILYDQRICILKLLRSSRGPAEETTESFIGMLEAADAYCGISRNVSGLSNCCLAYTQAMFAMKYGKAGKERMTVYSSCAIAHMLELYGQCTGDLFSILPGKLRNLLNDCSKDGQKNLTLLSCYINCHRSSGETANKLGMHRNTVIYRLAKIQEEYNLDFDDSDCLLNLMLMVKLAEGRK